MIILILTVSALIQSCLTGVSSALCSALVVVGRGTFWAIRYSRSLGNQVSSLKSKGVLLLFSMNGWSLPNNLSHSWEEPCVVDCFCSHVTCLCSKEYFSMHDRNIVFAQIYMPSATSGKVPRKPTPGHAPERMGGAVRWAILSVEQSSITSLIYDTMHSVCTPSSGYGKWLRQVASSCTSQDAVHIKQAISCAPWRKEPCAPDNRTHMPALRKTRG